MFMAIFRLLKSKALDSFKSIVAQGSILFEALLSDALYLTPV